MHFRIPAGLVLAASLLLPQAFAQPAATGWQSCAALADGAQRLACFDAWAARQHAPNLAPGQAPATPVAAPAQPPAAPTQVATQPPVEDDDGCHRQDASDLSRFWELEPRTSCGTFGLRGYRPISLSLVTANSVNGQPTSGNPANNATSDQPYRTTEMRIQLSVRSKLAQGLLRDGALRDSLWFGYSQQSYWQLFTPDLSRPFRSTDHEPEVFYVYPFDQPLGGGWKLRMGGLGLVHQSNGQSLPLSRSWNRVYLMAGAEDARRGISLQGKLWKRLPEDAADDDNPGISDYVGRAELIAGWSTPRQHRWFLTWRTPLKHLDRGSARLQWLIPVRSPVSGARFGDLNFHTQLFTGYGDTLLDYNRSRTVLSVGLSLFDW